MKKLSVKELKEKVDYRKGCIWDKRGCFNCTYSHEKLIMKNHKVRCGLHGFAFSENYICDGFEERKRK